MNARTTTLLFLLFAAASPLLHAQSSDTIVPNPKAVLLKRIWMVRGSSGGGERVGEGAAPLGSIVKDSLNDFAVFSGSRNFQWKVYAGAVPAPSTVPIQVFDSLSYVPAISGHFRQPEEMLVGFTAFERRLIKGVPYDLMRLRLHQLQGDSIERTPLMVLDGHLLDSAQSLFPRSIQVADLNKDGYSDLVILFGGFLRSGVRSGIGEVWIYEGGPNFQVDTPTVVLRDTEENDHKLSLAIDDFNGDSLPDLVLAGQYLPPARLWKLKFIWGTPSLEELAKTPERTIDLVDPNYGRIGNGLGLADVDGDQVTDLFLPGPDGKLYLWRMGISTKDPRTRSLRLDDADASFVSNGYLEPYRLGTLNDSTNRYEMMGLVGPDPTNNITQLVAIAGGRQGPADGEYEAWYSSSADGLSSGRVFLYGGPAGDVNGDGWSDYLTANPGWFGNDAGIAMILAGGPYIPRDDGSSSVQDIPAEGKEDALAVWPNPVRDILNIAWRGDLQRMPRRFELHTIIGERVSGGVVEPSVGAAVWQCEGVASGSYILTAYDGENRVIATTTVIKE